MARQRDCIALRHRISFEKQVRVSDGAGGWTETWTAEHNVWAMVEPLRGSEKVQAMRLQHPVTHRITVRYDASIAAYHRDADSARRRLDFQGRKMRIVAILDPDERRAFLEIMAEEGAAA
jgi:SPP1 family predicted phage head-tail adaptor